MKVVIEGVTVDADQIEMVIRAKGSIKDLNSYELQRNVSEMIASNIADQLLTERGPSIIESITNNQIINAVIMKVAGSIAGERR